MEKSICSKCHLLLYHIVSIDIYDYRLLFIFSEDLCTHVDTLARLGHLKVYMHLGMQAFQVSSRGYVAQACLRHPLTLESGHVKAHSCCTDQKYSTAWRGIV